MAKYWTAKNYEDVEKAEVFSELFVVASEILNSIPEPVALVSGPISTGGLGSIEKNLEVMARNIAALEKKGVHIFNQLPFENKFKEFSKNSKEYYTPILDHFYLPLFQTGKITKIFFVPGWETSTGAKWEYEQAEKLGIEKILL
ncbi:MAG: hypothetical protein V4467_03960 [Patescibacteria group bacterium]